MDLWLAGSMDLLAWMGSACAVHMLSTSVYSGNLPDDDGEVLGRLEQMSLGLSPRPANKAAAGAVTAPRLWWRADTAGTGAEEGAGRGDRGGGGRSRSGGERGGRRTGGKDQESL